ncbi:MAG TPA: PD-(D/E)XK nuclease family protein [Ktedonobacteraceae bacterium]|nr:PD-(D/E)XK nuclease family protein [Ktedonobacteraceae bacterium]
MNFSEEIVANLCAALEKEPLFHMSLGSKELFHSNFLAWFADCFPEPPAAAFRPWTVPMGDGQAGRSEREPAHLDLVLHLPGLAPIAIENKVFSVPSEEQLDRYAEGVLLQREKEGTSYARVLLSLMSSGWTLYKGWRLLSYRELAQELRPK